MRKPFLNEILLGDHWELVAVIEFIDLFKNDKVKFDAASDEMWNAADRPQVKAGLFKSEHVCELVAKARGQSEWSHKPMLVEMALGRLAEWGLVEDIRTILGGRSGPQYRLAVNDRTRIWSRSFADNIIRGPLFIIEKYKRSLPAIVVITSDGDHSIATGFLIYVEKAGTAHPVLVTNKHVTQKGTINKILSIVADGHSYTWAEPIESKTYDLTAIKVVTPPHGAPGLEMFPVSVLEDVIALGYPKVAVSQTPTLLAHKGEVNGTIKNRDDGNDYLAISCAVAPGNSGGPVLNDGGRVVGIVSISSIGRYLSGSGADAATEVGVHHLAVPVADLRTFINSEVFPNL